ncbi:MAG: deoxyribodipyrimidine photo-lyase [Lentimonas sp.]|jgi:deoxyribodipyrimidine photo-lyase
MVCTLVWFRNDLRLADNSALATAIEKGDPIIPVFIWAPEECGSWPLGGASKWWLHNALKHLQADLEAQDLKLILRSGASLEVLRALIAETGASRVFWNRRYEQPQRNVDAEVKRKLRAEGIEVESFNSNLLNEPHTVATGSGQPYKVYTPYWKKVKERVIEEPVECDLKAAKSPESWPKSDILDSFELMPKEEWYKTMQPLWDVSEVGAQSRLDLFLKDAADDYDTARDLPNVEGTSSLSPYLRWGQIGPRQVVAALKKTCDLSRTGPQVYLKEIYWREFAYNVLYHFPETPNKPLRLEYEDFPWENNDETLRKWQKGRTGYPIVDAGMRQLWETGWMHNRVRMIVSSLLVKHLLQDWRSGALWFWDTLLDADLASNTLGWQWSGGCGADAAPYFRVFNPILQGQKFDPDGTYVKRYVPELRDLPVEYIHEPWKASQSERESAGADVYPDPIIDHKAGRERALAALKKFKA